MPQHVSHDICRHIVRHMKNHKRLESAAGDEVSGRRDEKPPGSGGNG